MRTLLMGCALAVLVILLAACGGSGSGSTSTEAMQEQADLYAISQIQKSFHQALSTKDIELMMSIYAPNATITVGQGETLAGTDKIRDAWLKTPPFDPNNRWVSDSPVYKTRATANGDRGTLVFECHMIDTETEKAVAITGADAQLAKLDGQWLITTFVGGSATLKS